MQEKKERNFACCSFCDHSTWGTSDFLRKAYLVHRSTLPTLFRPFWSSALILKRRIVKAAPLRSCRGAGAS